MAASPGGLRGFLTTGATKGHEGPLRGRRSQRGFSLLEAVVALLVVSVALLLASSLFLEAGRRMADATRRALQPAVPLALAQLRGDVAAASGVHGDPLGERLELTGHPAGTVVYERLGDELLRSVVSGSFVNGSPRVVLRGARRFRWRRPASLPVVEIEIGYLEEAGSRLRSGAVELALPVYRTRTVSIALRGGGPWEGW